MEYFIIIVFVSCSRFSLYLICIIKGFLIKSGGVM